MGTIRRYTDGVYQPIYIATIEILSDFQNRFYCGNFRVLQAGIALTKMDFSSSTGLAKEVTTYLRGNTGNVNIFSASLLIKIPFMLIGISHYSHLLKKWFLVLSMTLSIILHFVCKCKSLFIGLNFYFRYFFRLSF